MAKTPPAKAITIQHGKRTRKRIEIAYSQGDADFVLKERDNPLPSLTAALDALAPVVAAVCHFPESYCAENCRIMGITLGEQGGVVTVSFVVRKGLDDAAKEFAFTTPPRLLAHPTEPGSYTPPLTDAHAALVWNADEQFKAYIRGERAQGQIAFDEDGEDDSDDTDTEQGTDPLPFPSGSAGKPAKKTKQAAAAK